jgi:hypothetical protein
MRTGLGFFCDLVFIVGSIVYANKDTSHITAIKTASLNDIRGKKKCPNMTRIPLEGTKTSLRDHTSGKKNTMFGKVSTPPKERFVCKWKLYCR